jgi:hypothetical protein
VLVQVEDHLPHEHPTCGDRGGRQLLSNPFSPMGQNLQHLDVPHAQLCDGWLLASQARAQVRVDPGTWQFAQFQLRGQAAAGFGIKDHQTPSWAAAHCVNAPREDDGDTRNARNRDVAAAHKLLDAQEL